MPLPDSPDIVPRPPTRALPYDGHTKNADLYKLLVDRVLDYAIFALDPTGRILTWNAGAQRLKGYHTEEVVGEHFSIFYRPEDVAAGKPPSLLEIAATTGRVEDEGWRVRKDGTRFWADVLITALRDDSGSLIGFAKVTRDLTERRAAQEQALADAQRIASAEAARASAEQRAQELRSLTDRLRAQAVELEARTAEAESANRSKGEFLAAMSHELRTPLNAIAGYVELMKTGITGPVTEVQAAHLDRIQRSQRHLLGVINDILHFSRIEAGRLSYDIAPVPLQALFDHVAPMIEPQAAKRRITLTFTPCEPSLRVQADRAKVEQILLNLLSNAVKFTGEGGRIAVGACAEDSIVSLTVRDTGVGIRAEHFDAIFAPFTQVGRSLANPMEGTGLGLAISRDLARGMNGDLTVESEEGQGSAFTLTLPRVA